MPKNEAKVRFNADTKGFNDAIKKSNQELSELRAEFKLNETEMQSAGKTVEGLEKKHENLKAQLEASQDRTEALNQKVAKAVEIFGENSQEVSKLRVQLANAQTTEEKLKKAVSDCEKEIKAQADAAEEAERASNKLTAEIDDQQEELTQLKKKYADLILENKECTDEAKDLERQIGDLSSELKKSKSAFAEAERKANDLDQSMDDAGDSAADSADGFTVAKGAIADLASEAIQLAIGKISEFIGYLAELPEATRELRQDMATLETSYETAGFTVEQATGTWKELYKIFGEDDRAVEAANHIAKFSKNQQDLNAWVNITKGIWGTYQDSLPVEGLAEAANETTKTGQVTGVLADALNWSSEAASMFSKYMSEDVTTAEDAFNVALSKCTTEQERQALITETLTALYGDAATKYDEASGAQTEAKEAAAENILVQSELGETIEPLTTAWQNIKTEMLSGFIPAAEKVSAWGVDALAWLKEHPKLMQTLAITLGIVAGALSAMAIAWGVYTAAQWVANTAILGCPLTWIIGAIVAVAAVIAVLIVYWDDIAAAVKRCWDAVVKTLSQWGNWINQNVIQPVVGFFKGLWDGIVGVFKAVIDWVKNNWKSIVLFIINPFAGVFNYLYENFEGFRNVVNNVVNAIKNFFVDLWNGIVAGAKAAWNWICDAVQFGVMLIGSVLSAAFDIITLPFRFIWENCKQYVFAAWEWIKSAVSTAINAVKNVITTVWNAVSNTFTTVWNACKNAVMTVWNAIVNFITPIINTIKNAITTAWNAIKSVTSTVFNAIKSVLTTIWNGIKNAVTTAVNAVKNTVSNVWNAVKTATTTAFNAVKNTATNIWNGIKNAVSTAVNAVKSKVTSVFNSVKSTVSSIFNGIKSTATNVWNGIKTAITKPIEAAKSKVKSIVDSIKGFFSGMKLSLPKIKLPHFKITGKLSISPPSVPKLKIDWYKDGGILTRPTIFGMNGGRLMAGGEAGAEAILPIDRLQGYITGAIEKSMNVVNLESLAAAVEDLANRPVQMNINGRQFAVATAGDTDNVSGMRTRFKERGLILD